MAPENIPIQLTVPSPFLFPLFALVNAKKNWCKFAQFAWRKFHLNSVHNSIYIYRERNHINRNIFNGNSKERGGRNVGGMWVTRGIWWVYPSCCINNIEIEFLQNCLSTFACPKLLLSPHEIRQAINSHLKTLPGLNCTVVSIIYGLYCHWLPLWVH